MSACRSLSVSYTSPSLPEPVSVAKSEDGKLIQSLISEREKNVSMIETAGQVFLDNPHLAALMGYHTVHQQDVKPITSVADAVARYDQSAWERLLNKSQFTMLMPYTRRQRFLADVTGDERPPFTVEHVIPTVQSWLLDQDIFFAERVDAIFHALSPEHITNSPAGFGGKMIFKTDSSEQGRVLDELRMVLTCLLGKISRLDAATRSYSSVAMINQLISTRQFGKLIAIDNGLISLKIHKVGTCHIYIDPEMAAHLNDILSMLYPLSIPAKFRAKSPIPKSRFVASTDDPIPTMLLSTLIARLGNDCVGFDRFSDCYPVLSESVAKLSRRRQYFMVTLPDNTTLDKHWHALISALGCVLQTVNNVHYLVFDYYPKGMAATLSRIGTMPDLNAFQFYPTRGQLAQDVASRVDAHHEAGLTYLEPSAGRADLLDAMDFINSSDVHTCELSPFFAGILRCKRYPVTEGDFLATAATWYKSQRRFDRAVMNPPFCNNQALDHTLAAYHLLNAGGKLFAVLPTSLYNAFDNLGCTVVKSQPYAGAFDGTNVSTFIVELHK